MAVVKGDKVKVHYRGTLTENGLEFDSSYERNETLNFEVGSGQMIQGFDNALLGMEKGDTKQVTISANEAYGESREEAIQSVPKTNFPPNFDGKVGSMVQGQNQMGHPIQALIVEEQDDSYVLDFNHPLAGKELNFSIELVDVE
jgi:FKBP-type peptidyl-prolyl cis-trans isomerase 2